MRKRTVITAVLFGGAFNGKPILLDKLTDVLLFRIAELRAVLIYRREQEIEYVYDSKLSAAFSANYDRCADLPFTPVNLVEGKSENLSGGTDAGDTGV